jgi:hypothetical protein
MHKKEIVVRAPNPRGIPSGLTFDEASFEAA